MRISFPPNQTCGDWLSLLTAYKKYVKDDYSVLEIGASTPERTEALASRCRCLTGVELMPERKPKDFANVKYKLGDWQRLGEVVEPGSIDLAVSSHVIEHVPDDARAIAELYQVLKPGGVALLNTPNRKRLTRAMIEVFAGEKKFPNWEHQREYVERDLDKLLGASRFAGYEIQPVVFGLHGGPVFVYLKSVPRWWRKYANFWQVHLFK